MKGKHEKRNPAKMKILSASKKNNSAKKEHAAADATEISEIIYTAAYETDDADILSSELLNTADIKIMSESENAPPDINIQSDIGTEQTENAEVSEDANSDTIIKSENSAIKKRSKTKLAAAAIIIVGSVMFLTAMVLEAKDYPWDRLFGNGSQSEASLPDPTPIILDEEDSDSEIVFTYDDTQIPMPSYGVSILPGSEEDTEAAPAEKSFKVIGIIKIPILEVSQNLLEGAGKQMKYGVGHVTGTKYPGQKGNCAVSGHRPYPFRYLDTLVPDDSVIIKMNDITYTYKVYDSFEVLPDETWVLDDVWGKDYTLTIITCTPYLVSSHRLIVRAILTDIDGMTPAEYYGEETPEPTNTPVIETTEPANDGYNAPSPTPINEDFEGVAQPQPDTEVPITEPEDTQPPQTHQETEPPEEAAEAQTATLPVN